MNAWPAQRGLAKLTLRTNSMTSFKTDRRPCGRRLFQLQYSRNPLRCQAITVSGLTMTSAVRRSFQSRESQTQKTLRRHVALKFVPQEFENDPAACERFQR